MAGNAVCRRSCPHVASGVAESDLQCDNALHAEAEHAASTGELRHQHAVDPRMNSLKLWLTLKVHGRAAYEEHIDRQIELARWFERQVADSPYLRLFAPPMLPIFNFCLR